MKGDEEQRKGFVLISKKNDSKMNRQGAEAQRRGFVLISNYTLTRNQTNRKGAEKQRRGIVLTFHYNLMRNYWERSRGGEFSRWAWGGNSASA